MNSFSTISLIVFCALLSSVFSYKCIQCVNTNSKTCNESEVDCVGDRCMTISQYFLLGEKHFNSVYKGCANESVCGKVGSATGKNLIFRGRINCCTGERCNNEAFQLPEETKEQNGVKCPVSYCNGTTDECEPVESKSCTGDENICLEYRGRFSIPDETVGDYSLKTCSNQVACDCNFSAAIGIKELLRMYFKC